MRNSLSTMVCRPFLACLALVAASPVAAQLLAAGDPTSQGAVLWAKVDQPGRYRFEVSEDAHFGSVLLRLPVDIAAGALTGQAVASGLKPEVRYHYRIVDTASEPLPARASFLTAPPSEVRSSTKFLFGADLGGQGYGRLRPGTGLRVDGWPIFEPMTAEGADFFLALGDMVYSDRPVTSEAPDKGYPKGNDLQIPKPGRGYVSSLDDYRRDWLYHRDDRHYDRFLRSTSLVATWDDHELVNDSGARELVQGPSAEEFARDKRLRQGDPSRPRGEFMPWSTADGKDGRRKSVFFNPGLYRAGRQAMFEWNPIAVLPDPSGENPRRLYRSLRWGAHVEVFVLDVRSYRDPRYRIDSDERPKTMLGVAQKRWLVESLAESTATWKFVASPVPLSIAGGNERDPEGRHYRDAWSPVEANNPYGYGRELREIASALKERRIANVVFLTADQHFSNLFAYDPDGDGRPDFHEANIGPLRAGPSPGKQGVDPTLKPTRLFTDAGKASFAYGAVRVDGETGNLTVTYHGVEGAPIAGARLELSPTGR